MIDPKLLSIIGLDNKVEFLADDVVLAFPMLSPVLDDRSDDLKKAEWLNKSSLNLVNLTTLVQNISETFTMLHVANKLKYAGKFPPGKLIAVFPTTQKDVMVFREALGSAFKNFKDVYAYFVVSPDSEVLRKSLNLTGYEDKVFFFDDLEFPLNRDNIMVIMREVVRVGGRYPLSDDGSDPFNGMMSKKSGWYLQQVVKMYIGGIREAFLSFLPYM